MPQKRTRLLEVKKLTEKQCNHACRHSARDVLLCILHIYTYSINCMLDRDMLKKAYKYLSTGNGITSQTFLRFMNYYRPRMRKSSRYTHMAGVYNISHDICVAKWQAMCCFMELSQGEQDQDECISNEQFYRLYEVIDIRWKQVTVSSMTCIFKLTIVTSCITE